MASGKHQHIVPQQMIKRFAGTDGKLVELYKPKLTIRSDRITPENILFEKRTFYCDRFEDFDKELLQKVEGKFAKYYPQIADQEKPQRLCGDGGAALIDWIAAMLCRTRALVCLSQKVVETENSPFAVFWKLDPAAMNNFIRSHWFSEYQDLLSRSEFCWKMRILPEGQNLVITDNPVCQTNGLNPGGQVIVVPLSKDRVLIGGLKEAIEGWGNFTVEQLNTFLAGWAERSIFAVDTDILENVKKNLEGKGVVETEEWCEQARKPFFGLPERIKTRKPPSDIETSLWWENLKDGYGQSIFPNAQ